MTPQALRDILLETLGEIAPEADLASVDDEESLREELDLDSMDFLRLVQRLHERLGVEVPELDYPQLDTLASAVDYLAERIP